MSGPVFVQLSSAWPVSLSGACFCCVLYLLQLEKRESYFFKRILINKKTGLPGFGLPLFEFKFEDCPNHSIILAIRVEACL